MMDESPENPKITRLVPKPGLAAQVEAGVKALTNDLIQAVDQGEVSQLMIIIKRPGGQWSTHQSGVLNFCEAIGQLEVLKQNWIEQYGKAMGEQKS